MSDILLEKVFSQSVWERQFKSTYILYLDEEFVSRMHDLTELDSLRSRILRGDYQIEPPRRIKCRESSQELYCNTPIDRFFFGLVNRALEKLCSEMTNNKSYPGGLPTDGRAEQMVSRGIEKYHRARTNTNEIGWEFDLCAYSKYLNIETIDDILARVEGKVGHSIILELIKDYYHSNYFYDTDGTRQNEYLGMKIGSGITDFL